MVEDKIIETAYIGLTKAGVNVEKTVEAISKVKFSGKIDPDEVGNLLIAGVGGAFVGSVLGVAALGNREQRGENVTGTKVFCYGAIPAGFVGAAIIDALQD